MKKTLLLGLAAAASISSAMADSSNRPEPKIYPDASFQRISADGRFILSELNNSITIYNLEDGKSTEFTEDYENGMAYSLGLGNCITADGSVILASTKENTDAAYYENGVWHQLDVPSPENTNMANGITPDGSRICGSVGLNAMSFDDVIMLIPAYWDRNNEDGNYGECHVLPYPTIDLFGETPQYLTGVAISSDGKTIVGQMTFSSGMMVIPVLYQQDEKGEWSYSFPTKSYFNPDKLEAVENPGDGPAMPSYESYMTPEQIAAYNAALNEYFNTWAPPAPEPEDFMSDEEKEAYAEAQAKFEVEYTEWEEKFNAYMDYMSEVTSTSPNFVFNNVFISTDSKYIIGTLQEEDPDRDPWSFFPSNIYTPCSIDIATGELKKQPTLKSCLASGVADNGIVLATDPVNSIPMTGYVIKGDEVQTVNDYITSVVPEYGEWIDRNMSHEVISGYDDEWEPIIEELTFGGMPIATPDMSVVAIWNDCPWDEMAFTEGVVFDLKKSSGIVTVNAGKNISVAADGSVVVPEGFISLDVYTLGGACVKSVAEPCGVISLDLASGVYVAKATRADGSVSVVKVALN